MKIDLDDLEHWARAATQGEWSAHVSDHGTGIDGIAVRADQADQIADTYDSTRWTDEQCIANAHHIAANSPPVTLALVARIRELEAALRQVRTDLLDWSNTTPVNLARANVLVGVDEVLEKGVVLP